MRVRRFASRSTHRAGGLRAAALLILAVAAACGPVAELVPPNGRHAAGLAQLLGPWSPTPFAVGPELRARVADWCRSEMQMPGLPLAVIDARGGGGVAVRLAGGGRTAECDWVTLNDEGEIEIRDGSGGGGTCDGGCEGDRIGPRELRGGMSSSVGGPGAGPGQACRTAVRTQTYGLAGAEIASVWAEVPGLPPIRASLEGGWYAVWWPNGTAARILARDGAGAEVASIADVGCRAG